MEHAEVLRVLLAEEAAGRDQATISMRRRASGLPAGKTFDAWEPDRSAIPTKAQRALRTLEWIDRRKEKVETDEGIARLFIYPGEPFRVIDALITNFHLPCSTPLVLVAAFAGLELIRRAYQEAIRLQYRFYSYGDAMLIL